MTESSVLRLQPRCQRVHGGGAGGNLLSTASTQNARTRVRSCERVGERIRREISPRTEPPVRRPQVAMRMENGAHARGQTAQSTLGRAYPAALEPGPKKTKKRALVRSWSLCFVGLWTLGLALPLQLRVPAAEPPPLCNLRCSPRGARGCEQVCHGKRGSRTGKPSAPLSLKTRRVPTNKQAGQTHVCQRSQTAID